MRRPCLPVLQVGLRLSGATASARVIGISITSAKDLGTLADKSYRVDLPANAFDSVGMSLLLHCLPGTIPSKARVFEHSRAVLAPGGVVFGATLLNGGVRHTALSRRALAAANRRGYCANLDDDLDDLDAALGHAYEQHEVRLIGTFALFSARRLARRDGHRLHDTSVA